MIGADGFPLAYMSYLLGSAVIGVQEKNGSSRRSLIYSDKIVLHGSSQDMDVYPNVIRMSDTSLEMGMEIGIGGRAKSAIIFSSRWPTESSDIDPGTVYKDNNGFLKVK